MLRSDILGKPFGEYKYMNKIILGVERLNTRWEQEIPHLAFTYSFNLDIEPSQHIDYCDDSYFTNSIIVDPHSIPASLTISLNADC